MVTPVGRREERTVEGLEGTTTWLELDLDVEKAAVGRNLREGRGARANMTMRAK